MIPFVSPNPDGGWGFRDVLGNVQGNYGTRSEALMQLSKRMAGQLAREKRYTDLINKSGRMTEQQGDNTLQPQGGNEWQPIQPKTPINQP